MTAAGLAARVVWAPLMLTGAALIAAAFVILTAGFFRLALAYERLVQRKNRRNLARHGMAT